MKAFGRLLFLALVAVSARALADPVPFSVPAAAAALGQSVVVDWERGLIVAEGRGIALDGLNDAQALVRARGAAITDAERLLLAAVERLRGAPPEQLGACSLEDRPLDLGVEGTLQGFSVVPGSAHVERSPDGVRFVAVTVTLPLYGTNTVPAIVAPELTASCREPSGNERMKRKF